MKLGLGLGGSVHSGLVSMKIQKISDRFKDIRKFFISSRPIDQAESRKLSFNSVRDLKDDSKPHVCRWMSSSTFFSQIYSIASVTMSV